MSASPVGVIRSVPETRGMLEQAMREIAATAAAHGIGLADGIVSRTITAPMKTVENANTRALKDMGIKIVSRETNDEGERVVSAQANDREIEILLEPLSSRTTRIRARAMDGILHDAATATEIILQTERVLAEG